MSTKSGETARSLAYMNNHIKIVNLIDNYLARVSDGTSLHEDAGLYGFNADSYNRTQTGWTADKYRTLIDV